MKIPPTTVAPFTTVELEKFQLRFTNAIQSVSDECNRQDKKWGQQYHYNHVWLSILLEEIGEIALAINEQNFDELEEEIIQAAAVLVQWSTDKRREDL